MPDLPPHSPGPPVHVTDALFVIGGFNGLRAVERWAHTLTRHSRCHDARVFSWRQAQAARRAIAALPPGKHVTLIGHSLGGGQAQRLVRQLPPGKIDLLITVAAFAPPRLNHELTRARVGHWLNILSAPESNWRARARRTAAPLLLGWREQGAVAAASENHCSTLPHHDFYRMMSDRCGAVEHGLFRTPS